MKILLTSTSFTDTPGAHHDLLKSLGADITTLRGPLKEDVLLPIIADYDAVVCGDDEYTRNVLVRGKAGKLRILSKYGIGLDKVDLDAAKELGIMVANTPGVNHITVAEHTFTLILSFYKNYYKEVTYVREGKWTRLIGNEIYGKNLAIFGLGRIGREVALRARAFGLNVSVYDPFVDEDFAKQNGLIICKDCVELFENADIITLHSPLTDSTRNILNERVFKILKNKPLVVNTARAGLIEKSSLVAALNRASIAGYVTDVMWEEPIGTDEELLNYDNVYITPHIGSRTYESVVRQGTAAIENLIRLINTLK